MAVLRRGELAAPVISSSLLLIVATSGGATPDVNATAKRKKLKREHHPLAGDEQRVVAGAGTSPPYRTLPLGRAQTKRLASNLEGSPSVHQALSLSYDTVRNGLADRAKTRPAGGARGPAAYTFLSRVVVFDSRGPIPLESFARRLC